jgi:hypothetical protein
MVRVTGWGKAPSSGLVAMVVALVGCAKEPEERCTTVGREGGLIYSIDNVLSIALQSEALDETTEFCVVESTSAPEIYGKAYRVFPNPDLHFAAAISYRFALPDDTDEINIGRVDADDYAEGKGKFESLVGCRVEENARQVTCSDDEIAKFYGLLDDFDAPETESIGDTTGDPTVGPTTNPSDPSLTTTSPVSDTNETDDPTDSTTGDDTGPPIDYPPECDDIMPGPFAPVDVGQIFEDFSDQVSQPGGAQDLTADGLGGFVARSRDGWARLDVTGATYGVSTGDPIADGFEIQTIDTPVILGYPSLGTRFLSNGDLIAMGGPEGVIDILHAPLNGDLGDVLEELVDGLDFANALYVDTDDIVWYSDFLTGDITRLDPSDGSDAYVTNVEGVNGVIYDAQRSMLFAVTRGDGVSSVYRQRVSATGAPIGDPAEVTTFEGFGDGISLDICGNVYVVDQGGEDGSQAEGRMDRVFMDDDGEVIDVELIFEGLESDISNARFATGDAYGEFQTSMFLVGVEGHVWYVDVGLHGAPMPMLSEPPPVLPDDGTTGG